MNSTLSSFHGNQFFQTRRNQFLSRHRHHINPKRKRPIPTIYSLHRRNLRPQTPKPSPDQKLEMVIDIEEVANRASASVRRIFRSSQVKFHKCVSSGKDTLRDFQTLVTYDRHGRIVIACRRSSLEFLGNFLLWGFVVVYTFRVLVKLGLGLGMGLRNWDVVRRRDRSLGGREVVVGRKRKKDYKVSVSPLSSVRDNEARNVETFIGRGVLKQERLPKWWPDPLTLPAVTLGNEVMQREANRLVRAIMDYRMSGKDITEDDIIQLRRICKTSGAKVSFETANARDSFYRASIDFVLNSCSNITCNATLCQIDGEDVRVFIAGLADNIGLEDIRAARIVCAAVAARTRSAFLQAWALEIQAKRLEVLDELLKICLIHQIFPPEEHSPEMEMVARGLEKNLNLEQREHLLKLIGGVCGNRSLRSMAEALGLIEFIHPEGDGVAAGQQ